MTEKVQITFWLRDTEGGGFYRTINLFSPRTDGAKNRFNALVGDKRVAYVELRDADGYLLRKNFNVEELQKSRELQRVAHEVYSPGGCKHLLNKIGTGPLCGCLKVGRWLTRDEFETMHPASNVKLFPLQIWDWEQLPECLVCKRSLSKREKAESLQGVLTKAVDSLAIRKETVYGSAAAPRITTGNYGDSVNHPEHYNMHPSGIECITIAQHYPFNTGNAIKYIWRAGLKGSGKKDIEDLEKAVWYLQQEIKLRKGEA